MTTITIYGIDRKNLKIRQLTLAGDKLSGHNADDCYVSHIIRQGKTAKGEAAIVFGLTDCYDTPTTSQPDASTKQMLQQMNDTIHEIAAARSAPPPTPPVDN